MLNGAAAADIITPGCKLSCIQPETIYIYIYIGITNQHMYLNNGDHHKKIHATMHAGSHGWSLYYGSSQYALLYE